MNQRYHSRVIHIVPLPEPHLRLMQEPEPPWGLPRWLRYALRGIGFALLPVGLLLATSGVSWWQFVLIGWLLLSGMWVCFALAGEG